VLKNKQIRGLFMFDFLDSIFFITEVTDIVCIVLFFCFIVFVFIVAFSFVFVSLESFIKKIRHKFRKGK